jgi:hypothetical protein
MDREKLESMTKPQLKDLLRSRNLPVSGTKEKLIGRLLDAEPQERTAPERDTTPAQITSQNLLVEEISVDENNMTLRVSGAVTIAMNSEKNQYRNMSLGTPLRVRL